MYVMHNFDRVLVFSPFVVYYSFRMVYDYSSLLNLLTSPFGRHNLHRQLYDD